MRFYDGNDYEKHKKYLFYAILVCASAVALIFLTKTLLFPFVLAFVTAALLDAPARILIVRLKLPRKLVALLLTAAIILLLGTLLLWAGKRVYIEARELLDTLVGGKGEWSLSKKLDGKIPEAVVDYFTEYIKKEASSVSTALALKVGGYAAKLPKLSLSLLAYVMSTYYIICDPRGLEHRLLSLFPRTIRARAASMGGRCIKILKKYVGAYLLMMLVTFSELACGLSIMRARYAMLIAAIVALLDVLPALGVGSVLVPWAAVALVSGDGARCVGLLVMTAVIFVVKQLTEPRIVGARLGLSPLGALFSVYVGYKSAGFVGMIAAPVVAAFAREILLIGADERR